MNKSGANKAAINAINASRDVEIFVRQVKYLNNVIEQDHPIKTDPWANAQLQIVSISGCVLAGIELMHLIPTVCVFGRSV
jgi:transposase-like protein